MKLGFRVNPGLPKHKCAVEGCGIAIPVKLLMCPDHWTALPEPLKRAVHNAFRNLELTKTMESVQAYRAAVERARNFINHRSATADDPAHQ